MPRIDAVVECPIVDSFRVRQIAGMFDVPVLDRSRAAFSVELPGLDEPWRIGAIVGPSGSGKATVARQAYGTALVGPREWPADRAVIDGFPDRPLRTIAHALAAVGFSSPPAWLRPFGVLSRGEQFRCELACALLAGEPLVVFDEFTSVVDRTVARVGSAAVGAAVRRDESALRFVAVTCHYDVLEWLEPDWVLDMAERRLTRGRLRRPPIELCITRCHRTAWQLFSHHHYLSANLNPLAECFLVSWNDAPVAFCAVLSTPGRHRHRRISRIVVLPDFQGIGIGQATVNHVAELYRARGEKIGLTTSHPAMIAALVRSPHWKAREVRKHGYAIPLGARRGDLRGYVQSASRGRAVVSFRYAPSHAPSRPPNANLESEI